VTTRIHKAIAVLDLNNTSVEAVIQTMRSIVSVMTANPYFTAPTPSLGIITSDVNALEAAQTAALQRTHGTVAERDAKLAVLHNGVRLLKAYVQHTANLDPPNADAIVLSAGMNVRKSGSHPKQDLVAKQGRVSGEAKVIAKAVAKRASYEWAYSTDQKTWIVLPTTLQAHATVAGLTPGAIMYFRNRATTKKGAGDWGHVVSLMVT
jgi:hypothetical protein